MRKKLLAGVMALALCSTNMLPQTILAGEFTSGNLEEVTEETPEIFFDDNQEVIEETEEELSVFSSESIPEFSNEANVMPATAEITEIDLNDTKSPLYSRDAWIISSAGSYRFNGNGKITHDPIIIKQSANNGNFYIYLNNVNIVENEARRPALDINNFDAKIYIYLEKDNFLESDNPYCALRLNSKTIINNSSNNNGSLTVKSRRFGIGDHHSNLTINGGSVTAFSEERTGIGGENFDITINGGSVTASSTRGTGIGGENSDIIINGGSVKATSVHGSPKNTKGANVYCCTIENTNSEKVIIDQNPTTPWKPNIHQAVAPINTNLYAWLTGEDHIVTVGEERRSYIFNSKSGTFSNTKRNATSDIFEFKGPQNFIYNGSSQTPSITVNDTIKGVVNFTVKYFKENDSPTEITEPKDVGTYIVKIDVNEGDFYKADSDITSNNWKFNITPGTLAPTITNHKGEYDGKSYPIININKGTIPENSTIKYSVDNKQTWKPLNSDNDIPAVKTVTDSENTKIFIRIFTPN